MLFQTAAASHLYLAKLVYLLFFIQGFRLTGAQIDPEINQTVYQVIETKGYQADQYVVETEDGYCLTLHRIRTKLSTPQNSNHSGRVVLLQHGLLDSAHTWVNNLANQSLGFILADAGYDVWLGNSRGSTYSQKHVSLDPNDDAFWQFSWDEMAKYDLPATIGFILNETGVNKIYYVGHSQGAQMALAKFNMDQKLRERVVAFAALAPSIYLENVRSPFRFICFLGSSIQTAPLIFGGRGRFLPSSVITRFLGSFLCSPGGANITASICQNIIYLIVGYNPVNLNMSRIPVYVAHTPAGTSVRNAVQLCQEMRYNRFDALDLGTETANLAKYNRTTPPPYGLTASALNLPTRVYYGGQDLLSVRPDVERILTEMTADPRVDDVSHVYLEDYSHLDFVWGLDAPRRVYDDIINFFQRYHQ